jgi:DNA-binding transcriptional ArsR family regulator
MAQFLHPTLKQITLPGVMAALSDPMRLLIVKVLMDNVECMSCSQTVQCSMAKSTISNHFRILREAGIIHTRKKGVENQNTVRVADLESKFPGLLNQVLKFVEYPKGMVVTPRQSNTKKTAA